jgi:putative tryptophan/tyrosine transport system substrate-binding protein
MMRWREFIGGLGVAAAAWPLAARAQQPAMPVVGYLSSRTPDDTEHLLAAFRQGLQENGYIEGRNVALEYRWALGQYDRLPAMAAELARKPLAVIVSTGGDPAALAAKAATSTIPIVFVMGSDPLQYGLVASYNRPDGNATGINILTNTMEPKRLGILHDLMPQASMVAALVNPKFPPARMQSRDIEEAARAISIKTEVFEASTDGEIDAAFQSIAQQRIPALIVASDPFFDTRRANLIALAVRDKLPTIFANLPWMAV